jgi:hypothetical protein
MAIMAILTTGILELFGPVRRAYQEATIVETKRTVCNSINKYITENLRYARFAGAYSGGSAQNAAQSLINSIKNDPASTYTADEIEKIAKNIQVIAIDYTSVTVQGKSYTGRLWRYKNFGYTPSSVATSAGTMGTPTSSHMAFGAGYYGASSFGINVGYDNGTLTVAAATSGVYNADEESISSSNKVITTSGGVVMQNIQIAGGKIYGADGNNDGVPEVLQNTTTGTYGSAGSQYFLAYVNAKDIESVIL